MMTESETKHPIKRDGKKTPEYNSWSNMCYRCVNPKHDRYADYGARGITVCPEWRDDFQAFCRDMGRRPEGTSLDRIDNNKGYYKANCRWATPTVQSQNKRPRRDGLNRLAPQLLAALEWLASSAAPSGNDSFGRAVSTVLSEAIANANVVIAKAKL